MGRQLKAQALIAITLLAATPKASATGYEVSWPAFKASPEIYERDPQFQAYVDGLLWAITRVLFERGVRCREWTEKSNVFRRMRELARQRSRYDETQGPLMGSYHVNTVADVVWGEVSYSSVYRPCS